MEQGRTQPLLVFVALRLEQDGRPVQGEALGVPAIDPEAFAITGIQRGKIWELANGLAEPSLPLPGINSSHRHAEGSLRSNQYHEFLPLVMAV